MRCCIPDADGQPQTIEAALPHFVFGSYRECGRNPESPVIRPDFHILKLRWIGEREMRMREWLTIRPRDEIHPVALVKARQPEYRSDRLRLTWRQPTDLMIHVHR